MDAMRKLTPVDQWISAFQAAVTVVSGAPVSQRPDPAAAERASEEDLRVEEKRRAAALMRVNHVGEICAQALYEAQAMATRDEELRGVFRQAAAEESDHLAWTRGRVQELGDRVSLLVPLWYAGAFAIGWAASALGDRISLGFMAETERQVEEHLLSHLDRLPAGDRISRAIVEQMKTDEVGHARTAMERGGADLPLPARLAMKLAARIMTTTAYYL
ncbi:2-nonaprenyl-3-methyl-6-methoxy-1,4-benzoquinol hydroxylase [Burkholderiales bacterium]|jgi:ubiquinone biosynthesis monooxygenase Coq7|nr:2-nonaprenyl-3-methyl-6-methoxy-1,4-benzoquinol hydroxylase [Burkholderiales bacterium]